MIDKKLLKQWVLYAEADLDAAKRLFNSVKPTQWTYLLTLWHCQQTIEKALKMIVVKKEKELLKIHDLPRLSQLAELKLEAEQEVFLKDLNVFYLHSRYPDIQYPPLPNPNKECSHEYLQKNGELLFMVNKTIKFPKKIIDHYINTLKQEIKIDGVLLFGSFAYGKPTKNSDIDLAIISNDFTKNKYRNRLLWLSRMRDPITYKVAMDIVGYTPKEFSRIEKHSAIMAYAKKHGKWLYKSRGTGR